MKNVDESNHLKVKYYYIKGKLNTYHYNLTNKNHQTRPYCSGACMRHEKRFARKNLEALQVKIMNKLGTTALSKTFIVLLETKFYGFVKNKY